MYEKWKHWVAFMLRMQDFSTELHSALDTIQNASPSLTSDLLPEYQLYNVNRIKPPSSVP